MPRPLPPVSVALGVAGVVPFIVCGLGAVSYPPEHAATWLTALLAYGAVVLSFVGAVHWGLLLASPEENLLAEDGRPLPSESLSLVYAVLPALVGWLATVLPLLVPAEIGLAVLIVGCIATMLGETRWGRRAAMPTGYMLLRWCLSVVTVVALVTVLALRLLGAHVIF